MSAGWWYGVADSRLAAAEAWLASCLDDPVSVAPLAGDASFRRYFRVTCRNRHYVLMDAPPGKEDIVPFLAVRAWLHEAGVQTPELILENRQEGFLLLEDFGDVSWAGYLAASGEKEPLFEDALHQLALLQKASPDAVALPLFDVVRMQRECDLYLDWYLPRVAGITPDADARQSFHQVLLPHLQALSGLPRVPVHLDFHSRNLMLPEEQVPLGVIDFQDAVVGPVTYDLASLLYDCYQDYPEEERCYWSRRFFDSLPQTVAGQFDGFEAWHSAVRLTAMQRHIKATGIFARLAYRDGKLQFLDEIPLTRKHLLEEMTVLGISQPLLLQEPAAA